VNDIAPNTVINGSTVPLDTAEVPPAQVAGGQPRTGTTTLGAYAGLEVGVWEMSVGSMRDTEVDELFVVIAGKASVEFEDGSAAIELGVGDIVRLSAGAQTLWTVHEPLRKVYLA
jgi:uncharacterized cupin superfamily protein